MKIIKLFNVDTRKSATNKIEKTAILSDFEKNTLFDYMQCRS